jgi:hypothetical protein
VLEWKRQIAAAGDVLVREYTDDGYSGSLLDRPGKVDQKAVRSGPRTMRPEDGAVESSAGACTQPRPNIPPRETALSHKADLLPAGLDRSVVTQLGH